MYLWNQIFGWFTLIICFRTLLCYHRAMFTVCYWSVVRYLLLFFLYYLLSNPITTLINLYFGSWQPLFSVHHLQIPPRKIEEGRNMAKMAEKVLSQLSLLTSKKPFVEANDDVLSIIYASSSSHNMSKFHVVRRHLHQWYMRQWPILYSWRNDLQAWHSSWRLDQICARSKCSNWKFNKYDVGPKRRGIQSCIYKA